MINYNTHIVFDLDDTLYKEVEFVKSAYIFISNYVKIKYNLDLKSEIELCIENNINYYDFINAKLPVKNKLSIEKYLELYRFHYPSLSLPKETIELINRISNKNIEFSIITDGRSVSQRNKINSLGLSQLSKNIIVSEETCYEKPHPNNFKLIEQIYPNKNLVYIADNTAKDFFAPNILGWDTICLLDNGINIHKQNFDLGYNFLPKYIVKSFNEIKIYEK